MTILEFSLDLPAQPNQLMKLTEDYENLPKYLPDQLKSVRIIEKNETETKTEETIVFSTLIKKEIIQQALHKKISDNKLNTEIISGPAKGTMIYTIFETNNSGSKIIIETDLKLILKAKILLPLIKKFYKTALTAVFYKMNNMIES
jgi:ribosome-associated toxin RatA of RatAB toxin-antitoxin module|tara:strand:+ start:149 stop:586 length:438 start_codon:yes stop_codon:yes gene_type:complete